MEEQISKKHRSSVAKTGNWRVVIDGETQHSNKEYNN